jgi:hypothetical protein
MPAALNRFIGRFSVAFTKPPEQLAEALGLQLAFLLGKYRQTADCKAFQNHRWQPFDANQELLQDVVYYCKPFRIIGGSRSTDAMNGLWM